MGARKDSRFYLRDKFSPQFRVSRCKLGSNLGSAPLHRCERGLSLISTLWLLTILSVLATHFLYSIRLEQRAQANFADRTKFHYAAKAGFERAVVILRGDETPYDSLGENWADGIEEQIGDGTAAANPLTYRAKITDEGTKININTADTSMMQGLLDLMGYQDVEITEQPLAAAIEQGRPYRTVRDLARVQGMTPDLLYGQGMASDPNVTAAAGSGIASDETGTQQGIPGLVDLVTVYSIDKNTDASGNARVNINSAEAQQLTQIQANNNQPVFSQGEADALIQSREFGSIGDLIDATAVTEQVFDNIRDQISIESGEEDDNTVNINTADAAQLQTLDSIDEGIADRIIDHRNSQGNFQNVDQLKDVKLITEEEFRSIVDQITTMDDAAVSGFININTAPQEILQLLPGMDADKAQAVISRRESEPEDNQQAEALAEAGVEGNPFENVSQLLDVEGIDMDTFRQIAELVTYRSQSFLVEVEGIDRLGKTIASCVGVLDRTGEQIATKYWKQN
jgi:competence ComEA-like helix-hairpin-helix protein